MKDMRLILIFTVIYTMNINAQNLDVEGSMKVSEMPKDNSSDSIIVKLEDGSIGIRDRLTLSRNIERPLNPQDAATKAYVDALITDVMNDFAHSNEFFTSPISGYVIDQEGNYYDIVKIAANDDPNSSQWWMADNLKATHYNDGSPILKVAGDGDQWASLESPAYCWYNNDSSYFASAYGALYNYYAVSDTNIRNVCPVGWHVPRQQEWNQLSMNVDYNGGALKDAGITFWASPNAGATNSTGFTAVASGERVYDQLNSTSYYDLVTLYAYYWMADASQGSQFAHLKGLVYDGPGIIQADPLKQTGLAVRCIRDK